VIATPAWLAHRRSFAVVVAIGVALAATTLRMGLFCDDYVFVAELEGVTPKTSNGFDLYEFATGHDDALVRRGLFPWWCAPGLKVRFFRPLSSALFALDHAIFGRSLLGYHLHALAWYFSLLLGVGLLLRRVLSRRLAIASLLLFALSATHVEPVGWASSRHLLFAAAPSIGGLALYVSRRERGLGGGRFWAVGGLVLGLLAGETALGSALYWMSYEAMGSMDGGAFRARAKRAAMPLAIAVIYTLGYKVAGYGVTHSEPYVEPFSEPARFVRAASERVPLLLADLFAEVPSSLAALVNPRPLMVTGLIASLVVAALVRSVWRFVSPADQRALRWLALGGGLSLLTTVGGFPGSRLLLLPGIGGYALIAAIILHGWEKVERGRALSGRRAGAAVLFAIHVVLSPLAFVASSELHRALGERTAEIAATLDASLGTPGTAPARPPRVFILAASDPFAAMYVGAARALRTPGTVSSWIVLSMAHATHRIERVDAHTLVISARPGLLYGSFEGVFRANDIPFHPGDAVELDEARVTVLSAESGHPTSIEVLLRGASLDDPTIRPFAWIDGRLTPVHLDAGAAMEIAWSPGPTGFF